jgi:aspartate racemase
MIVEIPKMCKTNHAAILRSIGAIMIVSATHMNDWPIGRCIGLIGGLGVGASVYYYRELAKMHAARGRVLNLVMAHAHVNRVLGAVQAGDKDGLASYLAGLIGRLEAAGAEFAVIPAVAPHISIAELIELSPLPIVNLIDELKHEIEARKLHRFALFGTRFAVESQLFGHLAGMEVVTPHPDEVDYIHATYLQVVSAGTGLAAQREGLSRLAHTLIKRDGVEAVILAGTELALVFDDTNTDFPNINGAQLHLDAIARRALD